MDISDIQSVLLADEARFGDDARRMVRQQLIGRAIRDRRVLEQMRAVPRHLFVDPAQQPRAYDDAPLPTRHGQTISQPYIVARMTELLDPQPTDRVLEIGSGCGYQTMILARLAHRVVSLERDEELAALAKENVERLGVSNVSFHAADGTTGWADDAPYQRILVTAAAPDVPPALLEQLADPGCMVIPVGDRASQHLMRIEKDNGRVKRHQGEGCRFVPLVGAQGWPR